jgi:glucose-1-phosphate cytidylyltransferase
MKVVLFCGGQGFMAPGVSEPVPKPMTQIGYRPVLWHVMRYYAGYGHKDFVLCLGTGGEIIKDYFLGYEEALSNDFVLGPGPGVIHLLGTDIDDWNITFVDTGAHASVGERLSSAARYLAGEEMFLANYGDVLTDLPLPEMIDAFAASRATAALASGRPNYSFHVVSHRADGTVTAIADARAADLWVNAGCFLFRSGIFAAMRPGEDLVDGCLRRLARRGELQNFRHEGFWAALDTLKDLEMLRDLNDSGSPPWAPARPVAKTPVRWAEAHR